MGVFIDYAYHIECSEDELVTRLRRLRQKLKKLPFDKVSRVLRVDPAYHWLPFQLMAENDIKLPPAVAKRLKGKFRTDHDELCMMAVPMGFMHVPRKLQERFYRPALDFMKTTTLWREEDFPEQLDMPFSVTYYRAGLMLEMAAVMLRHGYLIAVQPCEGCEAFKIALTSHRTEGTPLWLGSGFTKTQYATRFVEAHETICKALDLVREEGLLLTAKDTCKFYNHRDWSKSADIVNAETTFARVMRGLLGQGIQEARKQGINIQDISDPATNNYNLVQVPKKGKKKKS